MATRGYAEGGILNDLELGNIGGGCVGEPDRGGVAEEGVYEGLVGCYNGLFLLAPRGASEGFQEREPLFGSLDQIFHMLVKVKMGVKCDAQNLRV